MSKVTRREFLTAAAVGAGAAALTGCQPAKDPYALAKPPVPGSDKTNRGEEKWVSSICSQCLAGCGIRVRVVEGRAVKIEGHPDCSLNLGRLGPKGLSGIELLYHPDRITGPMQRVGPRGSGEWKPVEWDDAIKSIAKTLGDIRAKGQPQGLVVLDGDRGAMRELWQRFLLAYGSPNHIDHRSATDGGKVLAMNYMHGVPEVPAYDWEKTRYVLGFGASLYESWCQTIHYTHSSSHLRRGIPGRRVKFVQVAPRFSVTAAKADEWLPINPATYGALALGLAHILVRDKQFDEAFVREHTFGFENWKDAEGVEHRGFRDLVTKDYTPEKAAKITGIAVKTIERVANEMVVNKPAVAVADGGAAAATNGLGTAMAIHALNALLGNLERPGGLLVQRQAPLAPWAAVKQDEVAKAGSAAPRIDDAGGLSCPLGTGFVQGLSKSLLTEKPYPAQALFLYRSNPVFSKPDGKNWLAAIQKVPLVVSFSPLPDESTFWADFILPDHTYLERWDIVEPISSLGFPTVGLRQPVVAPRHKTMATGDVLIGLAKAMGAPMDAAFNWADYRKACEARLKGLLAVKDASITAEKVPDLVKAMQARSSWSKPGFEYEQWDQAFKTPSKKFEFFSQQIAAQLKAVFPTPAALEQHLSAAKVATRGDDLCLPHWEPAVFAGDANEYPFVLLAYRGIEYAEGGSRQFPWLRTLPNARYAGWKERVELNPKDAQALGLREESVVVVESPQSSKKMTVMFSEGVPPGAVAVPLGLGNWPPKPEESATVGGYALLVNNSDPLAGILALQGTRVRIRKES
jgi:anaerobic selenocysteine-containing dehydrogenase